MPEPALNFSGKDHARPTASTSRRRDALWSLPARAASGLVWIYQKTVSPALVVLDPTGGCRFAPSCSHYARGALEQHGLIMGSWFTVCRLAKCGPWHPGGEDPVPPRKPTCTAVSPRSSLPRHPSLS